MNSKLPKWIEAISQAKGYYWTTQYLGDEVIGDLLGRAEDYLRQEELALDILPKILEYIQHKNDCLFLAGGVCSCGYFKYRNEARDILEKVMK